MILPPRETPSQIPDYNEALGSRPPILEGASARPTSAFAYDIFVIHAAADESFVRAYLLAKLALPPERVLVLQALELGRLFADEIERGVRSSRVTIVVLSPAYVDNHWAVFGEQIAAYASIASDAHSVLLPLLLGDCQVTAHVQSLVKLDFRDPAREVWDAEAERLRSYLGQPAPPEPDLPCPYPGMRPFTEGDADRFFGRDAEIDRIIRRLRRGEREIYIIGASGCGKSSLIAAGLVPRLLRGVDRLSRFHVRSFRPGERPLERLAAVLEGDLAAPTAAIDSLLPRHAPATSMLIVIDQLEELFAIADENQRRGFFTALRMLRTDLRCVLVFTLRADFYGAFMESPLWTDRSARIARIDLGPLRRDGLRMVIERPARNLDVYFQPELVAQLLHESAREPGALPLLQETLIQLWGKRRQRLLAMADYQSLGDGVRTGLAFALQEHADDVLAALSDAQRVTALRIFLRLVNFGEGRADTRRQQLRSTLQSADETATSFDAVLQRLVKYHLVTVTGDDQHGDVRVDLAHEILIHAWSTLAEWIRIWRGHEQRRRELEAAAAAWRARGSGPGGLLDPVELASATAWRTRTAHLGHTPDLAAFLAASEAAQTRGLHQRRRRIAVAFAAAVAFATITSTLGFMARNNANEAVEQRYQHDRLLAESLRFYQSTGQQRLIEGKRPLEALTFLVAARETAEAIGSGPSSSLRMLFAEATRSAPQWPPLLHQGKVLSSAFSADATRIVTASFDHTARVWDSVSGTPLSPPLRHQARLWAAAFSPDGTRVVTASEDHTAQIWDATSGKPVAPPLRHQQAVLSAAFSPDGTRVLTTSHDHTARVWVAASGAPLTPPLTHHDSVVNGTFSLDGSRVVTASRDHTARIWDAASGRPLSPPIPHQNNVTTAMFSPDGTRIVTASEDHTARVWDASGTLLLSLHHEGRVWTAAFSPDGLRIVTASEDETARIWDATSGQPLTPPLRHQGQVASATFSPDGSRVVTASFDQTARVWDGRTGRPVLLPFEHQRFVVSATFSPDGTHVVTASFDHTARVWNIDSQSRFSPVLTHSAAVRTSVFSPDGEYIVTAGNDHTARLWRASGQPLSPPLRHQDDVYCAVFSPDGTRVITASADRTARVWDVASGRPLSPPILHQGVVRHAAFSPDGTRIVTASDDHTAHVWSAASGQPLSPVLLHHGVVRYAAFSPDGTRVATASDDHTARVWDATTGQPLVSPLQHQGEVRYVAFSPSGARIVTASADRTARVWDATSGQPLSHPLSHQDVIRQVAFSPDGTRIVTASDDATARVWDAASGEPISPPLPHQGIVFRAAFSPDGTRVVTASNDDTARIWDAISGLPLSPPLLHAGAVVSAAFSPDGVRVVTASEDASARIWEFPLASGSLADWRAIAERASPYVLVDGILQRRAMSESAAAASATQ